MPRLSAGLLVTTPWLFLISGSASSKVSVLLFLMGPLKDPAFPGNTPAFPVIKWDDVAFTAFPGCVIVLALLNPHILYLHFNI